VAFLVAFWKVCFCGEKAEARKVWDRLEFDEIADDVLLVDLTSKRYEDSIRDRLMSFIELRLISY
jgi:hypothetical protein